MWLPSHVPSLSCCRLIIILLSISYLILLKSVHTFLFYNKYYLETLLTYSDSSKISFFNQFHQVGSVVVGYHQRRKVFYQKLSLRDLAKVYNAKLAELITGLLESIFFANQHPKVYHIQLYADNISAIFIASNPKPQQDQLMVYIFYQKALR